MARINNFFTDKAHLSDEAMALYVDALRIDEVDNLPTAILSHVADCLECKMQIVEIFSLIHDPETSVSKPNPSLDEKNGNQEFSIAFRIAAVLVLGISIGLVSYYFRMLTQEHTRLDSSIATRENFYKGEHDLVSSDSLVFNKQEFFADNFSASPNLENLVNANSRSLSIQVESPLNGEKLKDKILFRWKVIGDDPVVLKILSNKEKTLQTVTVRGSRYEFFRKMPPGLYYWKLENRDELLYLGKFLVE